MQRLHRNISNLPKDQLELSASIAFLVKDITRLLPLSRSAHFVCFEPCLSWLTLMPSIYYGQRRQQQLVSIHSLHIAKSLESLASSLRHQETLSYLQIWYSIFFLPSPDHPMFIFISSLISSYFLFFEDFEDFRSDW